MILVKGRFYKTTKFHVSQPEETEKHIKEKGKSPYGKGKTINPQ